ncbi:MAG: hypothetical protein ACYC0X_31245 [Pirellulaceae bacterium]
MRVRFVHTSVQHLELSTDNRVDKHGTVAFWRNFADYSAAAGASRLFAV